MYNFREEPYFVILNSRNLIVHNGIVDEHGGHGPLDICRPFGFPLHVFELFDSTIGVTESD
jgi:hypothetical protein